MLFYWRQTTPHCIPPRARERKLLVLERNAGASGGTMHPDFAIWDPIIAQGLFPGCPRGTFAAWDRNLALWAAPAARDGG
jgi:hypothetical protein